MAVKIYTRNPEPALGHSRTPKGLENVDKQISVFEKRLKNIRATHAKEGPGELLNSEIYQALLDTILDLIPLAEQNYRHFRTERAAYALNALTNQVREIMNDMRASADFSQTGLRLVELIAQAFTLVLQNLVQESEMATQQILQVVDKKHHAHVRNQLDALTRAQGRYLSETLKSLRDQVMLQFSPQNPAPPPGRKQIGRG